MNKQIIEELRKNIKNIEQSIIHAHSASPSLKSFIKGKCKNALMDLKILEDELNVASK